MNGYWFYSLEPRKGEGKSLARISPWELVSCVRVIKGGDILQTMSLSGSMHRLHNLNAQLVSIGSIYRYINLDRVV